MKQAFENIFVKMGVILLLIIILLIPAIMVQSLIEERQDRHEEAVDEVSAKHAEGQTVIGPVLTIPYAIPHKPDEPDLPIRIERGVFHILPESLKIDGDMLPKKRKRGIFEVAVYESQLHYEGDFANIDLVSSGLKEDYLALDKAYITLGISDLKGVLEQVKVDFNGKNYVCEPGVKSSDVISTGLHINCPIDSLNESLKFSYDLDLNGSQYLNFVPIGKETVVELSSTWKDPSFDGNFIPVNRTVTDSGFAAEWKILNLNRNYPQSWKGSKHHISHSQFGVDLDLGVDVYQKSMRVAKYAMLFIVLTYLVFFFVEIINKILIHPIQYILVGIALVLFYVLMLAFSEQIAFDYAYLLAAGMTIGLIFIYAKSILKTWGMALMTSSILTILYGFIFIIIQLQDLALLFGSLGVFLILGVTMYFSRKINWFEVGDTTSNTEGEIN
jgi:inner membrane protein